MFINLRWKQLSFASLFLMELSYGFRDVAGDNFCKLIESVTYKCKETITE